MMKKHVLLLGLFFWLSYTSWAQTGDVGLGERSYELFERQAVLNKQNSTSELGVYPLSRSTMLALADSLKGSGAIEDQLDYLEIENIEFSRPLSVTTEKRGLFGLFYQYPGRLAYVDKANFGVVLNPVLYLKYSNAQDSENPVFQNTRGLSLRGHIDKKVFFQSQLLESQASLPDYAVRRMVRDTFLQGNGFFKRYNSDIFNISNGYDFLNASGRFGFRATPSIEISFGYDRNFIGSGYRSLFLSDFANNYSSLRINTKVWKIQYQNIFAEFFNNGSFSSIEKTKERKFFVGHYLKFNFTPNFHIGLFEGVIYDGDLGLQAALLNPIIFYRSIEGFANQQGNAMLGADFRLNAFSRFSFYGQLILDEFKFDEFFGDQPGWWANKFGIQLGAKYFDVLGIKNLDGFIEYNVVRPYTYGHRQKVTSYSHFNQPLAHPLGANFKEVIVGAKYYLNNKITITANAMRMSYGDDVDSTNWGANILLPYTSREQDYNNTISQGIDTDVWLMNISLSYMFGHDLFVDLEYNYRSQNSDFDARDYEESYVGLGVRMNIARLRHWY